MVVVVSWADQTSRRLMVIAKWIDDTCKLEARWYVYCVLLPSSLTRGGGGYAQSVERVTPG